MRDLKQPAQANTDQDPTPAALPGPEARAQRLRDIKERIRSGCYNPDIKDVAYLLATMMSPR